METLQRLFKDDSNAHFARMRASLRNELELTPGTPDCLAQFVVFLVQQRKREPSWVTEMIESVIDKPAPVIPTDIEVINTALRTEITVLKRDKLRAEREVTELRTIVKEAAKGILANTEPLVALYVESKIVKPLD